MHAVDVDAAAAGSQATGPRDLELCLTFSAAGPPSFEKLAAQAESRGYRVQRESLRISFTDSLPMWRFWVVALDRARAASPDSLAQDMATADGVASFSIVPVRN